MALSAVRKAQLARMTLPGDAETVQRVRAFMFRSGLGVQEFAEEIGYSYSGMRLFLQGRYDQHHARSENTLAIRAACKEYIDVHELQEDVRLRGDHYETEDYKAIRRSALNALRNGKAYVVDGPPGTQKTWSLLNIKREINEKHLGRAVYVYARVDHSPQSFLQECCTEAGIPSRGQIDALIRKLRFFLGRGRTLFMVDEAQHLDIRGLEVLRQLLDNPPYFGVIVAGSHDLTQRLQHWQMEQWRQRNQKTHFLNGPSREEARAILKARLGITDAAEADSLIADCMATGSRVQRVRGKEVSQQYEYIAARLLFGVIEGVKDSDINLEAATA